MFAYICCVYICKSCFYVCFHFQQKAPIDVADALKLLSGGEAFQSPLVRKYAVDVLRHASDEELRILLLQLVQALRYEPVIGSCADGREGENRTNSDEQIRSDVCSPSAEDMDLENKDEKDLSVLSPLGQFLVERACSSTTGNTGIFCRWYLVQ